MEYCFCHRWLGLISILIVVVTVCRAHQPQEETVGKAERILAPATWYQLGSDVPNIPAQRGDFQNWNVDMTPDGKRFVVGLAAQVSGGMPHGGLVRVFELKGGEWTMIGEIWGTTFLNLFGSTVAISADGNRILAGSGGYARVYDYDGTNWSQFGHQITRGARVVAMNADGNRLLVRDTVSASIYDVMQNTVTNAYSWSEVGTFTGSATSLGTADMTSDGSRVVIGWRGSGAVVYELVGDTWVQVGSTVSETDGSDFATAVAINDSGDRIAVVDTSSTGWGYIYEYQGTDWVLMAEVLDGLLGTTNWLLDVVMNDVGDRVVFGVPNDAVSTTGGAVVVFDLVGSTWTNSHTISGLLAGETFGTGVGVNSSADRIVVAATGRLYTSPFPPAGDGFVQVYQEGTITTAPSEMPSATPSQLPSTQPSLQPNLYPSSQPTTIPSSSPSLVPTVIPSTSPTFTPSALPSVLPSPLPSRAPSASPSSTPSFGPSVMPSASPSFVPSQTPPGAPSVHPSGIQSFRPTFAPSGYPNSFSASPCVAAADEDFCDSTESRNPAPSPTQPPSPSLTKVTCEGTNTCGYDANGSNSYSAICVRKTTKGKVSYRNECWPNDELSGLVPYSPLSKDEFIESCGCCAGAVAAEKDFCQSPSCTPKDVGVWSLCKNSKSAKKSGKAKVNACVVSKSGLKEMCVDPFDPDIVQCGLCL